LVILQSRALPGIAGTAHASPLPEGVRLLLEGGVTASPGVGAGELFRARHTADMPHFPTGAVLLVEQAHARWAPLLNRASAVLSERGGAAGHLASVAREYGLPALFGIRDAARFLADGAMLTVDADSHRVLAGRVEEALTPKRAPRAVFVGSPVYRLLERAAEHIVPLTLLDPESPAFAPKFCQTLHDIIRFCHQKSVEEMFRVDETLFSGPCGKQLVYRGGRLQYFVVNIGSGFCSAVNGRHVGLEDICCPPMRALWQGMIAVPWAGPPETGTRGFLALVAESAGNPELEVSRAATRMVRNYFMVDREYCRLQAGFGYHFCTVEALAGEREQENYVNFHCAGGAAALASRILRVQALAEVLGENGFSVKIRGDVLSARVEELSASEALKRLGILGYLIIHTRQTDAILHGEADRAALADSLRKGIGTLTRAEYH
jgi:pyruvate,water dikinase